MGYIRPYEISIEVSENSLRRFGITLDQVAQAIRTASLDMPGGTIRTNDGEILIRTAGQAYNGSDFANVVVLTNKDGTRVTLRDIATVRDGFEQGELVARYNNQPAVVVNVAQVGSEDLITIAEDTRACLLYTSPSPRDATLSRMPSSA